MFVGVSVRACYGHLRCTVYFKIKVVRPYLNPGCKVLECHIRCHIDCSNSNNKTNYRSP